MVFDNDEEIFNQWNSVKKRTQEKIVTASFVEYLYQQQLEKVAFL